MSDKQKCGLVALGALAAAVLILFLAGCEFNPLSPSTNINVGQQQQQGIPIGGTNGTPTPDPAGCAANIACALVVQNSGQSSSFRMVHSCPSPVSVVCVRQGDELTVAYGAVASGDELDPGVPGAGGGIWTCRVNGGGSCTVTLDS